MAYNDILLHIDSYPEPTAPAAVDRAVNLAAKLGGKLSALAVQVKIPLTSNRVADYLIGLSDMVKEEEAKSLEACRAGLAHFTAQAKAAGVFQEAVLAKTDLYAFSDYVAKRARTRDLCIVPLGARFDGQQEVAQTTLFDSGRPVLVFKADAKTTEAKLDKIVLAWDGGRAAARAMAEALPILTQAKEVRILTVVGEKPSATTGLAAEAARHLRTHGVAAAIDEVEAGGERIGVVLDGYLKKQAPDLLVMGAYGHSRLRELVLGGATQHILWDPPVPVFLSL